MAQYKFTKLTYKDLDDLGIINRDTQRDIIYAKRLMMWDRDTYANLLPGLKYNLEEAVDRVELMDQADWPFDEPDYLSWTGVVGKSPDQIAILRRLIAKHETAFATSTKWCVDVRPLNVDELPCSVREDFMTYLCGVEEWEKGHAGLQGVVMAGPDRIEVKGLVSGSGQGSNGETLE